MVANPIAGNDFLRALVEKGIVPPLTRRVVIDAQWDWVLMIYVEVMGDERLLDVGLEGASIVLVSEPEGAGDAR